MLRLLNDLIDFKIQATDGKVGDVSDFYFDDLTFNIRYLVADTGGWFSSNYVLLSPMSIKKLDFDEESVNVDLDKDRVKNSPSHDLEKPISREYEESMAKHYEWPLYWTSIDSAMFGAVPLTDDKAATVFSSSKDEVERNTKDYHLRSAEEWIGYTIQAKDGEVGEVEDFIVDDEIWSIRYAVVDTGNFLKGKKVLIAIPWLGKIDWETSTLFVDLTKTSIEKSPEFDPSEMINKEYEEILHDHYQRPKYWEK